jgi:hypothetical protein
VKRKRKDRKEGGLYELRTSADAGLAVCAISWTPKKTLCLCVAAIIEAKQAASFKIAALIAVRTGVKPESALVRFYRLLHNHRIEDLKLSRQLLACLSASRDFLVISLDWTEWHPPLHMLLASVICRRRAIPVLAAAFSKSNIPRSQNTRENTFLKLIVQNLNSVGKSAVFLADRGFRRASFLKLLLEQKGHHFVVRIAGKIIIEDKRGKRLLVDIRLKPGQVIDLGWVRLRQDGAVTVRLIGVWAKGQKEPWWLATDLKSSVEKIVSFYDRRMSIEEQIRDTKGSRFGFKLFWTQIQEPDHLSRFMMILAFALLILTAAGAAILKIIPAADMPHPTKGPRLSYITIALNYGMDLLPPGPLSIKWLQENLPPPLFRKFDWIKTQKNQRKPHEKK